MGYVGRLAPEKNLGVVLAAYEAVKAAHPRARLVVVDVAPDAASDAAGTPHAGPAGDLLDKMLAAMHLQRSEIWLTSLVLCHAPADAPPTAESIAACQGFLGRQLDLIRPDALLLFGEVTARAVR